MQQKLITIENADYRVSIAAMGAEMKSLYSKRLGAELLWSGQDPIWPQTSPILFPVTGRSHDTEVEINGTVFPMPIHGFAMTQVFDLTDHGPSSCKFTLKDTAETRQHFPFNFALSLEYSLDARGLTIRAIVENTGDGDLPYSFGFHPGFVFPLPGCAGEKHWLWFESEHAPRPSLLCEGFPTGEIGVSPFEKGALAIEDASFAADSSLLFTDMTERHAYYGIEGGLRLSLSWKGLGDFVLWRPQGAKFLCIEPWCGTPPHLDSSKNILLRPNLSCLPTRKRDEYTLIVATA